MESIKKIVIGVDPGMEQLNVVVVEALEQGDKYIHLTPRNASEFKDMVRMFEPSFVLIEKNTPSRMQKPSQIATSQRLIGVLIGVLEALDIAYQEMSANKWRMHAGITAPQSSMYDSPNKRRYALKKAALDLARKEFPKLPLSSNR